MDTISQKLGRFLIVLSGNALLLVFAGAMKSVTDPPGSWEGWRTLLATTFDRRKYLPISGTLLGTFVLANLLNLWGLWPEIRRTRLTIRGGMIAVVAVAVICACLRQVPLAGLALIVVACLMPRYVLQEIRRDRRRSRSPEHRGGPAS